MKAYLTRVMVGRLKQETSKISAGDGKRERIAPRWLRRRDVGWPGFRKKRGVLPPLDSSGRVDRVDNGRDDHIIFAADGPVFHENGKTPETSIAGKRKDD
jgi:hypothetical protein